MLDYLQYAWFAFIAQINQKVIRKNVDESPEIVQFYNCDINSDYFK